MVNASKTWVGSAPGHRLHMVVDPQVVVPERLGQLGQLHRSGPCVGAAPAGVLELPALGDEDADLPEPDRSRRELPPLHLAHHREQVLDVDRVDLDHLLVVDVHVDEVDPIVVFAGRRRPGPARRGSSSSDPTAKPKWSMRGQRMGSSSAMRKMNWSQCTHERTSRRRSSVMHFDLVEAEDLAPEPADVRPG